MIIYNVLYGDYFPAKVIYNTSKLFHVLNVHIECLNVITLLICAFLYASCLLEIILLRLENEGSFHRRIDLFFLVDSITQLSASTPGIPSRMWVHYSLNWHLFPAHISIYKCGLVGVAGAVYRPAVQAALPRLIHAAAPPGNLCRDNRRQCLRVSF